LPPERYDAEFAAETGRFAAAAAQLDPARTVPTCPEWTVRDLVGHVGTGHRWSTRIVAGRLSAPPPYELAPAPDDPAAWAGWLAAGAEQLVSAVRDRGWNSPVWTWRTPATAGFWVTKMTHDVLVHRFDVELAAGTLGEVPPDLAADGVADLLASIATLATFPNHACGGLLGPDATLGLHATDAGESWVVDRSPTAVTWRPGTAAADVTVRAPARELLLLLNRRLGPEHAEISGESALLAAWLAHARF
jgi:uncharacterized protein (TIGR03083 family)